ncbi:MAG: hypothetical protein U9R14_04610 [Patescibacteria group bacterium]|nr:hypothetical protein [Patescibacteria group bacterium]
MINTNISANNFYSKSIGWKYYNTIKKKAMEQEFNWSGLLISLSIAFFIVVTCAQILNFINQSIIKQQSYQQPLNYQIYHLEKTDHYLHKEYISSDRMRYLPQLNLVYMNYKKSKNNYFI